MIDGVQIIPLKVIPDSRGRILHFMRKDHPAFKDSDVQEVYFSLIYPGAIKAWHRHSRMTLNYVVPVGNIKLVLYDTRADSPTAYDLNEYFIGENSHYQIIRVPPMIWNGFMSLGGQSALVSNVTNSIHDPSEMERMHPQTFSKEVFQYSWGSSFIG